MHTAETSSERDREKEKKRRKLSNPLLWRCEI